MTTTMELCACGEPLHYSSPDAERLVRQMIELSGEEYQKITVPPHGTWLVQKHYIALHGISAAELLLMPDRWELVIGHDSDFECDECGGPSPATSTSGCAFCDGQGDIVPRGKARFRTWRPRTT